MSTRKRRYWEILFPTPWIWFLLLGFVAMLAIAFGAALGAHIGWLIGIGGGALAILAIVASSPIVAVDDEVFRVGRARLPHSAIGRVKALDAAATKELRDGNYDASWYWVIRPVTGPAAVVVEVIDERDPHPAWIVTSRHPARLAAALDSQHV
mgnify:CR=1 FL=1